MNIVEASGLSKIHRMGEVSVAALQGVSLKVRSGEFVAVSGPSGSGKSTLLNLLGCLDTPTSGTYRLAGRDVSAMDDDALSEIRRDRIGFIFQSFNLIPQLSVVENIGLPLIYADVSASERRERARRLAETVGLAHRTAHRPAELSGGELQRVAIARALANDPVLILADEPTGNLDSRTGREIMALLQQLWRRGATLVVVTHEENIARQASRNIHLVDGRVERDTATAGAL